MCLALVSAAAAWSGTVPLAGLRSAPLRHAGIGLLGAGRPRDFAPAKGVGVQRNAHHLGRPDLHLHPRGLTHAHAAPAFSLSHRAWRAASVPCTGQQSKVALRAVVGELGAGAAFSKWFKGLSGAALAEAIRKTFAQFDSNGDGLLDRCSAPPSAPDRQEGERSQHGEEPPQRAMMTLCARAGRNLEAPCEKWA